MLLTVEQNDVEQRVDNFLIRHLKQVPKSCIYRLLRKGAVRVNELRKKPSYRLQLRDRVIVPELRMKTTAVKCRPPQRLCKLLETKILYEDDNILVVNKPPMLAVHAGTNVDFGIIDVFRSGNRGWLELVHRLDRETSGCLLLAKNRTILLRLQELFRQRAVLKTYMAFVHNVWPKKITTISAALQKNKLLSGERIVTVNSQGRTARTNFVVVKTISVGEDSYATLLRINPVTGRTHQIRVHCSYQGFPIIGDDKYCYKNKSVNLSSIKVKRLMLHAESLSFIYPGTDKKIEIKAKLDADMQRLADLEKVGQEMV